MESQHITAHMTYQAEIWNHEHYTFLTWLSNVMYWAYPLSILPRPPLSYHSPPLSFLPLFTLHSGYLMANIKSPWNQLQWQQQIPMITMIQKNLCLPFSEMTGSKSIYQLLSPFVFWRILADWNAKVHDHPCNYWLPDPPCRLKGLELQTDPWMMEHIKHPIIYRMG